MKSDSYFSETHEDLLALAAEGHNEADMRDYNNELHASDLDDAPDDSHLDTYPDNDPPDDIEDRYLDTFYEDMHEIHEPMGGDFDF